MEKNFYDIIPNEKRSIRNIPIPKKKKDEVRKAVVASDAEAEHISVAKTEEFASMEDKVTLKRSQNNESFEDWEKSRKGDKSYWKAYTILALIIVFIGFLLSTTFARATITISPVRHDLAIKDLKISFDELTHESISGEDYKAETEVDANGSVKVDRKAVGTVVLYNAYSSTAQKLVAGTRLETPKGLIYKLKNAVTIPGQTTSEGKKTPGSVSVEVEASESGDKYNSSPQDFKVVAYKGTDKYNTIYGRSKSSLTDGFSGTVPNISQKAIADSLAELKKQIQAQINADFLKQASKIDGGFVYIKNSAVITYAQPKQDMNRAGTKATITLTAKATALIFDESALSELIIQKENPTSSSTSASSTTGLSLAEEPKLVYGGIFDSLSATTATDNSWMVLNGTTSIASIVEELKLAKTVSGLSKEQALSALKDYIEVDSIDISIIPWWVKTLPSADKIKVVLEK